MLVEIHAFFSKKTDIRALLRLKKLIQKTLVVDIQMQQKKYAG